MLVPVYGFLEGDTMGLLVLAHDDMPIAEVMAKLRAAARVRTAWGGEADLLFQGRTLDPMATVAESGIAALDRIDVQRRERSLSPAAQGADGAAPVVSLGAGAKS